jgi:cell division protein ZapA (FtsZ GTPase activity inhibitor)
MCVEVENREQSEPEKDCSLETAERDFVFVTDKKKTDTTPQTSDNDKMMRVMDDIDSNRQFLKDQLHYDDNTNPEYYKDTHSDYPQFFSELFEVVCDVVCVPRKTIRVGGKPYPYDVVRSRFLKLTESDLAYVIECVKEQTGKIKNMRAYLITALYFSHESSGLHLAQKVQYDQYGKKQEEDRREQEAFEKKKQEMIEKNNRFLFGQMSEQEREEYQSSPDFTWLDFHRDREGEFDLKNGEKQYWN